MVVYYYGLNCDFNILNYFTNLIYKEIRQWQIGLRSEQIQKRAQEMNEFHIKNVTIDIYNYGEETLSKDYL